MSLRQDLIDCLPRDEADFQRRLPDIVDAHDLDSVEPGQDDTGSPSSPEIPGPNGYWDERTAHERELARRLMCLDSIPLGLTLAGPAYRDNPLMYANETFERLTGYGTSQLRGENLRVLQGPETESAAVTTLHEAIETWTTTTVELWNYRRDGTRFRNRVSLVPLRDGTGMVTNWLGIQADITPTARAEDTTE